jgi:hypothetical protein
MKTHAIKEFAYHVATHIVAALVVELAGWLGAVIIDYLSR